MFRRLTEAIYLAVICGLISRVVELAIYTECTQFLKGDKINSIDQNEENESSELMVFKIPGQLESG